MMIEIENTSSPGASFTPNTNMVLLKTYEWICDHKGLSLPFRDFRMDLQRDKGVNDNNNRNIYPLLKNGGLAEYEKGTILQVDYFYTNTGLAYVKAIESSVLINAENYTKEQKAKAIKRLELIQNEIIYGALKRIVSQPDVNYVEPLQDLIRFMLQFGKINKREFAYLLYLKQNHYSPDSLGTDIERYRAGAIDIQVKVKVRNDYEIREAMKTDKRKEDLSFLTSYGYFTSLLQQAGLIMKSGNYFFINDSKRHLLEQLGGI